MFYMMWWSEFGSEYKIYECFLKSLIFTSLRCSGKLNVMRGDVSGLLSVQTCPNTNMTSFFTGNILDELFTYLFWVFLAVNAVCIALCWKTQRKWSHSLGNISIITFSFHFNHFLHISQRILCEWSLELKYPQGLWFLVSHPRQHKVHNKSKREVCMFV